MSVVTPAGGETTASRSWPEVLSALMAGRDLNADDTAWAMDRIMSGEATDVQIAGFAVALRAKGETVDEVTGMVRAMYEHANTIEVPGPSVDIVGTTFNFLGPLTNPARVRAQATGVADLRMAPILAGVLAERGSSALVFRGDDGLDELTTTATSQVWVVRDGKVEQVPFDPRDVGLDLVPVAALRGADAAYNAGVARQVLAGETGPVRDAVLLNSAAALVALSPTSGSLEEQISAGLLQAAESIDSGRAAAALERWAAASNA
jgi:anthranilate phosphoribosyltransferase